MPKITNTRKQRALELLDRLRHGPSFYHPIGSGIFTETHAREAYYNWFEGWVEEEILYLIPELKKESERKLCPGCFRGDHVKCVIEFADDEGRDWVCQCVKCNSKCSSWMGAKS